MFRAMLWKELREQAAILIALLALGSGVIAAAATLGSNAGLEAGLGDFRAYTNAGRLAVLALTIAAGVVVGGSLFAGEIENETMGCLEMLPARRVAIWRSKLAAGSILTAVAAAVLLDAGAALGALGTSSSRVWIVAGASLTFVAFAWGTFGSTIARSTLGACAGGLLGAVVFGVPIFSLTLVVLRSFARELSTAPISPWTQYESILAATAVILVPFLLGGALYTAPDRARFRFKPIDDSGRPERASSPVPGRARVAFWLARRQWTIPFAIGSALALATGLAGLLDEAQPIVGWPLASCFAGVCAGVLSWTDEQSRETFRFWGERRLPPGRPWAVKLATSFGIALVWLVLLFLPVFVRSLVRDRHDTVPRMIHAFGSGILGFHTGDLVRFLLVWPLHGLAFGHLAGLLFRKTIVALGVGLLVAAPLAAFWLPSLVTGGVHGWQLWPIPVAILAATRWLVRPWAADRLATARPLGIIAGLAVACFVFLAFSLAWRFLEIPVVAEIDDDIRFAETVPQLDSEDGGRMFRAAIGTGLASGFGESINRGAGDRLQPEFVRPVRDSLARLVADRWPSGDLIALEPWFADETIAESIRQLIAAAAMPPGPIENPRALNITTLLRESLEIAPAVHALLARGLLDQRRDRPDGFLAYLDASLAVTRNARTQQPTVIYRMGLAAERPIFEALDRWLERLEHRPDLASRACAILLAHRRRCPRDPNGAAIVDRMVDRNTLNDLPLWAPKVLETQFGGDPLRHAGNALTPARTKAETETEIAGFAIVVPWERERLHRILGMKNAGGTKTSNVDRVNTWFADYLRIGRPEHRIDGAIVESETLLELALAQTALTIFAWERGRPAKDLAELVPDLLPEIPRDLHARQPLGYRISQGESIDIGYRNGTGTMPAGLEPNPEFAPEGRVPYGGLLGGFAFADLPIPTAPGLTADGFQLVNLDFVAAVAGGLVQWPLEGLSNEEDAFAMGGGAGGPAGWGSAMELRRERGSVEYDWSIVRRKLAPGQGVVWGIGPDGVDGGGRRRIGSWQQGNAGDWLRVVPPGRTP